MSDQSQSILSPSVNENGEKINENTDNEFEFVNIDELTHNDLIECVNRAKENPVEPFTFLKNIADTPSTIAVPTQTDIDIQLATLSQRIQLNKLLLEKTNNRIKRVNFSEEISEINEETDITSMPSGISDVDEALKSTLETLTRMKELISKSSELLD